MPTPSPAALDRRAATLREQAAALSREMADRQERIATDFGVRIDEAKRTATTARAAAEAATAQAKESHDAAKESFEQATRFEAEAARIASNEPFGEFPADDLREHAQLHRANATAQTRRAERAERAARQHFDDAERADREASQAARARTDSLNDVRHLYEPVQKLEEKAFGLEQAAHELRTAETTTDPVQRAQQLDRAEIYLTAADSVTVDYSRVDLETMVAAGIPVSEKPGAELMAPTVSAPPVPLDDTDLMNPTPPGSTTPGSAAGGAPMSPPPLSSTSSAPGALADDDLIDPVVPSTVPAGSGHDPLDELLMDPLSASSSPGSVPVAALTDPVDGDDAMGHAAADDIAGQEMAAELEPAAVGSYVSGGGVVASHTGGSGGDVDNMGDLPVATYADDGYDDPGESAEYDA